MRALLPQLQYLPKMLRAVRRAIAVLNTSEQSGFARAQRVSASHCDTNCRALRSGLSMSAMTV
jgi:hypothetical protein